MKKARLLPIFVAGLLLASCGGSDGPTITLNDPADGETFQRGTDMHFDMDLADESGLASYTIEIDGEGLTNGWNFSQSWQVEGTSINVHHHEIVIPDNIDAGTYHFEVVATNADGNSSDVHVDIILQ